MAPALRSPRHPHRHEGAPASSVDFGRIFPNLPPFAEANDTARAALLEVGKPGGIMDAGDQLSAGPKALIVDPSVNGNPTAADPYGTNPDNPTMTAGSTFVGQFVDHDITFDQTSTLGVPQNPLISRNTRTPALDLDSVFGGGPGVRPDLYVHNADGSVGPKLKLGSGGVHEDIPRVADGDGTYRALLGDPRNDESVIIGGLHCAHILFYNRLLDELSEHDLRRFPSARHADRRNRYERFLIAREVTLWHYQWLLVNEHLPQIAGQAVVNEVLRRGNRFYRPPAGDGFMPIEFAAAAYRFGHSMVRPSYRANFTSGTGDSTSPTANPFFALVFDPNEPAFSDPVSHDRADLLGGYPAPRRYIGWQTFFDLGDGQVKNNKKIDTTISSVLFTPAAAGDRAAHPDQPDRAAAAQPATPAHLGPTLRTSRRPRHANARRLGQHRPLRHRATSTGPSRRSTPLWYYILAEAKARRRAAPRPRRRPDRHRNSHRPPPRRPHQLPQRPPPLQPFLGTDLQPRTDPEPEHHRQPHLHPRPLPPLRRRRHARHISMITQLLTPTHLAILLARPAAPLRTQAPASDRPRSRANPARIQRSDPQPRRHAEVKLAAPPTDAAHSQDASRAEPSPTMHQ